MFSVAACAPLSPQVAETCQLAVKRLEWLQRHSGEPVGAGPYLSVDPAPPADERDVGRLRDVLLDEAQPLFERYRAMFALRNAGGEEAALALAEGESGPGRRGGHGRRPSLGLSSCPWDTERGTCLLGPGASLRDGFPRVDSSSVVHLTSPLSPPILCGGQKAEMVPPGDGSWRAAESGSDPWRCGCRARAPFSLPSRLCRPLFTGHRPGQPLAPRPRCPGRAHRACRALAALPEFPVRQGAAWSSL